MELKMGKKKKYTIGSVALSTIGSAVLGMVFSSLVVFSLGSLAGAPIWLVLMQCVSLLIFIPMIYSPSWYCGDRDANSVQFGRIEEDLYKGLRIGLMAMIPFALTPILLVITKLGMVPLDLGFIYRILNIHLLYAVNALIPPTAPVADVSWLAIAGVWLFHLCIPIATFIGYRLGYLHISISERLIFKNLPKNANNKKH